MSRPKLPSHLKIVKGTAQPCRMNKHEPKPTKALGNAAKQIKDPGERAAYKYLKSKIPAGVAFDTDEPALIMAAKLWHEIMTQEDFKAATYTQLTSVLARFGMTPSDRQKVSVKPEDKKDAWDDL